MKIQKLVLFLLCFLNCTSSQCMEKEEKKNCYQFYEPFPGKNLDPLIYSITTEFYKIYKSNCNKSKEDFHKKLSEFLKKDPVFKKDNPSICYDMSLQLLMQKFTAFYNFESEKEIKEGFLNRWRGFLK